MGRSYGYNSQMLLKKESSYGVSPAGNYFKMPFNESDIGDRRGYSESPRAGAGRTKKELFNDAPQNSGQISVPVCMRNMGFHLEGLLGAPVTTGGSDPYTHTFNSEKTTLPSYSIEIGHPALPAYYMNSGLMYNTMAIDFARSGPMSAVFGLIGQAEAKNTTSQGGTPVDRAAASVLSWSSHHQCVVQKGGSNLGNVSSARLNYSNGLIPQELLNQTNGQIAAIDLGQVMVNGNLSMRFGDDSELDDATSGTPVDLDFFIDMGGDMSLRFTVHEAYLEKTVPPVRGPGGIEIDLNWVSKYNTSESAVLTAVLINDEDGSLY